MPPIDSVIDSFERLVGTFYLPVEYPGLQRFICYLRDERQAERLVSALAHHLQQRVPASGMRVCALCGLDWSSREALVQSLATKMADATPSLAARLPHLENGNPRRRADQRLRALMDPPDAAPDQVLTFVMAVSSDALREDMLPAFAQLRGLISASDHNWVIVAPLAITSYGEGVAHQSPFHTLFETYEVSFDPALLPEEWCR
jgi:hypothetical protein